MSQLVVNLTRHDRLVANWLQQFASRDRGYVVKELLKAYASGYLPQVPAIEALKLTGGEANTAAYGVPEDGMPPAQAAAGPGALEDDLQEPLPAAGKPEKTRGPSEEDPNRLLAAILNSF